mgnify:CR=1 FL=1
MALSNASIAKPAKPVKTRKLQLKLLTKKTLALKQNEGFSDTVHRSADWRQGARQKTQNAGAEVPNSIFRSSSTTTAAPCSGSSRLKTHKNICNQTLQTPPSCQPECTPLPSLLCVLLFCKNNCNSAKLCKALPCLLSVQIFIAYLQTCLQILQFSAAQKNSFHDVAVRDTPK